MLLAQLERDLANNKIEPVYLFHGAEDYLIEQAVDMVRKAVLVPGDEDFNLEILYGSEVDGSKIVNIASSYPMMAARRVVIVREFHKLKPQHIELVGKYCTRAVRSTCLILAAGHVDFRRKGYSAIKDNSYTIEFKVLYDNMIPEWLRQFCQKKNLKISNEAIRLLHNSVGNSLRALAMEINKLELNLKERKNIEIADVETVVGVSKQFNVFELCNAVGQRKLAAALKILHRIVELGEQPTIIIHMLGRHFTILLKIKELVKLRTPQQNMAGQVGINQFFLKDYLDQERNYEKEELYFAIQYLLDADIKLKTSYQKNSLVLDLVLYQVINKIPYRDSGESQ